MTRRTLTASAEAQNTPLRTLEQVKAAIAKAEQKRSGASMAKLMLGHGRLTDDARAYLTAYVEAD